MDLLEITKKHAAVMLGSSEFDFEDGEQFSYYVKKYKEIEEMDVKPYLVIIHSNMWEVFHDLKDEVMEYLGYEEVGRMGEEYQENEKYIFECEDETYDILFRLKSPKADYTKTLKF